MSCISTILESFTLIYVYSRLKLQLYVIILIEIRILELSNLLKYKLAAI